MIAPCRQQTHQTGDLKLAREMTICLSLFDVGHLIGAEGRIAIIAVRSGRFHFSDPFLLELFAGGVGSSKETAIFSSSWR